MSLIDLRAGSRSAVRGGAVPEQRGHRSPLTAQVAFGPAKLALPPQPENLIDRQALVRRLRQATQPAILVGWQDSSRPVNPVAGR